MENISSQGTNMFQNLMGINTPNLVGMPNMSSQLGLPGMGMVGGKGGGLSSMPLDPALVMGMSMPSGFQPQPPPPNKS